MEDKKIIRDFKVKEFAWKKEKALYEQKIE